MGKVKRILLTAGIALCAYPLISQMHAQSEERKVVLEYQENPSECNVIGVLEIPQINVLLPIYSGVTEDILQKGVGHMQESSPLGGGRDTHCLLAGHRGLPNATLLTRLGEIENGDTFYIEVNHNRYAYRVCEIRVVKPDETEGLGIQKDRDLVSLITCTPYGINTHRLIVTGERMEEKE